MGACPRFLFNLKHHDRTAKCLDGGVIVVFSVADDIDDLSVLSFDRMAEIGNIGFRELIAYLLRVIIPFLIRDEIELCHFPDNV